MFFFPELPQPVPHAGLRFETLHHYTHFFFRCPKSREIARNCATSSPELPQPVPHAGAGGLKHYKKTLYINHFYKGDSSAVSPEIARFSGLEKRLKARKTVRKTARKKNCVKAVRNDVFSRFFPVFFREERRNRPHASAFVLSAENAL